MNLQICFVNDSGSDKDSDADDSKTETSLDTPLSPMVQTASPFKFTGFMRRIVNKTRVPEFPYVTGCERGCGDRGIVVVQGLGGGLVEEDGTAPTKTAMSACPPLAPLLAT